MNVRDLPRLRAAESLAPAVPPSAADRTTTLKITMVLASLSYGGAQRVASLLANHWVQRGDEVRIVTFESARHDRYELDSRVVRVALDIAGDARSLLHAVKENSRRLLALRRAILASRANAILSFGDQTNVVAALASCRTGIPCVIAERTDPRLHRIGAIWEMLRQLVYPMASVLVVQTRSLVPWASAIMRSSRKARVVRNPVRDMSKYVRSDEAPVHRVVVAAGRLAPEKAFDVLLTAFARLNAVFPEWRLIILGEGPERPALETLADTLGISARVSFPGWMSEPGEAFSKADLFVMSSRYEGFPNALLEAMACRLPVISTDCVGSREIVTQDVNGVLVPVDSVDDLTIAMAKLMAHEALRCQLADAAFAASEDFSLESVVSEWDNILTPGGAPAQACRV